MQGDGGEVSLLNTAEAARFLRVSQASIRRWSDAGLLHGKRVGRRRERRFARADLMAFMDQSVATSLDAQTVSVGGVRAAVPLHLATLYASESGRNRLAVSFLAEGVRLGQPTFLIAGGEVLERYRSALDLRGVTLVTEFRGRTASDVIPEFEEMFAGAVATGANLIRVVGDPASVRPRFTSGAEFLSFEEAFELMSKRYPVAVLCQYDVREFDGVAILRALKAHPDLFGLRSGAFLLN